MGNSARSCPLSTNRLQDLSNSARLRTEKKIRTLIFNIFFKFQGFGLFARYITVNRQ